MPRKSPQTQEFHDALSYRMRQARMRLHGMTQTRVDTILGYDEGQYQKWEDRGNLPLDVVVRFCELMHIDLVEFLSSKGVKEDAMRKRAGVGVRKRGKKDPS